MHMYTYTYMRLLVCLCVASSVAMCAHFCAFALFKLQNAAQIGIICCYYVNTTERMFSQAQKDLGLSYAC